MTKEEVLQVRYGEWWQNEELMDEAKDRHNLNVAACKQAMAQWRKKNRPISILAIHGSGRSSKLSCAEELSNSQMLLNVGLRELKFEFENEEATLETVALRDYNIEPCNCCVSSCSALCAFPCNCFPFDPMQQLYPKLLRADIIFCSTGVNQSGMASRLKIMEDRMISLDGGFLVDYDQYELKDSKWKDKCLEISLNQPIEYAQRLHNKVAAYFISSKDQHNPYEPKYDYVGNLAKQLFSSFDDYGIQHASNYYAYVAGRWTEDYAYDKARLNKDTSSQTDARKVVREAYDLAMRLRKYPAPKVAGRVNRT